MQEEIARQLVSFLYSVAALDGRLVFLIVLIVISVIVLDGVFRGAEKSAEETGFAKDAVTVSIDGSKTLPVREYVSQRQGLAGRPDALILENGFIIPVERKPLAKKIRDRYVAQVLVYMRLIEEFEGKKPPYGYLILGPNCRRFKIENTPERQAWLQKMIDEMREVLEGAPSRPTPHPKKCRKCYMKDSCTFKVEDEAPTPRIRSRSPALSKSVEQ